MSRRGRARRGPGRSSGGGLVLAVVVLAVLAAAARALSAAAQLLPILLAAAAIVAVVHVLDRHRRGRRAGQLAAPPGPDPRLAPPEADNARLRAEVGRLRGELAAAAEAREAAWDAAARCGQN